MNDLIHTAGEGVNYTIIQCVHEQILTGICIFPVFYLPQMDHLLSADPEETEGSEPPSKITKIKGFLAILVQIS